ncbi:hypothetical protein SteCoe_38350 [Stentor coeruleus]|uniref:Uncharacterized protein n=1 Tax=Stentor coeruleus TaxID=5963 RepID=A0A1R2ALK8_9CILI|nr:hypothetical protein SteCoe_38350 [Stentor coeruleus]
MDKKDGKFVITFRTGEVFTGIFSRDEREGEGVLDYSNYKELLGPEIDYQSILINNVGVKNMAWINTEICEILKKKGIYLYYSNPDKYHMLAKCYRTTDISVRYPK